LGRVLLGVGMSCNLMGSYKLLTMWFSPRMFATLAGILVALGTMGNMVATTPLVLLVGQVGWRISFQLFAIINLVLTFSFFAIVRDRPTHADQILPSGAELPNTVQALDNLKQLFRSREYWIISLATFTRYGIFAGFQALWAGPYLMEVVGLPALTTGNLILVLNVGMIVGSSSWGALSDRLFRTRKWLVIAGTLGMAVSIILLSKISVATPFEAQVALFFCFGFFNSAGLLMYPHIKDLVPAEMSGAAMTGINFFTMIGPAVFLQGLGTLMQTLYPEASRGPAAFSAVFVVCIVCLGSIAILYCFAREKRLGG
jgi:sugar phosphate permease